MSTVFILPSFSSGRAHGVDFDCLASVCNSTFDLRPSRVLFDVRGRSPSCAARCMNRSCSRHEYSSRAESVGHWQHHFFSQHVIRKHADWCVTCSHLCGFVVFSRIDKKTQRFPAGHHARARQAATTAPDPCCFSRVLTDRFARVTEHRKPQTLSLSKEPQAHNSDLQCSGPHSVYVFHHIFTHQWAVHRWNYDNGTHAVFRVEIKKTSLWRCVETDAWQSLRTCSA